MSQNLTFSAKEKSDIEKIKQMLIDRKTQLEMSRILGLRRETINRKIRKWVQTEDFETWLKQAWLEKYQKVSDAEAFKALTMLLGKTLVQRIEAKEQVDIRQIIVKLWRPTSEEITE